jgi:hypothetical protein
MNQRNSGRVDLHCCRYIFKARCSSFLVTAPVRERFRPAVLNVRPVDMVLVEDNIIQLALIDHFPALLIVAPTTTKTYTAILEPNITCPFEQIILVRQGARDVELKG